MLVRNKDIQRLLVHYEELLFNDKMSMHFIKAVGWDGGRDKWDLEEAIKAMIRLEKKGIISF